ncbi:MAG: transketolase [Gammaproteobacteria bacterium]|nr:MAG: transketolase [Gammaproteobacteria bacterium]
MPTSQDRANAIRALSMDAVQRANSGHPGAPMGMSDIAEVLWRDHLRHSPNNPDWVNRDRFVLSNGHGSMLLYSLLHLTGYALSIDDLKNFRTLGSKTPGHPEHEYTPGIETTTGPLGQGLANAVGFAIAERMLSAKFNAGRFNLIDHNTYVFLGDGCLMEGISHEACSLAGTMGLGKLICFYDDNGISIDGQVDGWFTDDTVKRFEAYGWQVISAVDGHDADAINDAIVAAKADKNKPTLICCKTIIGFGSPSKAGTASCHGAPLGAEEILATRKQLGWNYGDFEIPDDIYKEWDCSDKGNALEQEWNDQFIAFSEDHSDQADELKRRLNGDLPKDFDKVMQDYITECTEQAVDMASRKASENALQVLGPILPELVGGSADLAGSNLTRWKGSKAINATDFDGNYIDYGVREFAMSAIMNGITLHGGFIPYGGTFLMFMEYARNAVRMAALMKQRTIFVYTHDSIGVGEDGPTHQPIEQLTSLRSTPNLNTWRPSDTVESAVAWKNAVSRKDGPSALIFSRQTLKHQERSAAQVKDINRGGYILKDCDKEPELIIIATGSEVGLAMDSANILADKGVAVRVVSMPSCELYETQEADYKESVLPSAVVNRIAIEAGHPALWYRYTGLSGRVIGMETYGESAPGNMLFEHFGFTTENVVEQAEELLEVTPKGV